MIKTLPRLCIHFQVSFANTDPTLSDLTTYKNFIRVIPNELDFNIIWMRFLQEHDWKRVILLFQDATSGIDTYAYVSVYN